MTSTRSLFNTFVNGLANHLAGFGFERDKRVFRRFSRDGDVLIVELQTSRYSTRTARVFYLNVALVLAPQWDSDRRRLGLPASELPRIVHSIRFPRIGEQWQIEDGKTLATVSENVRQSLDERMPRLQRLLDRDTLFVDAAELFGAGAERVRAWLPVEEGRRATEAESVVEGRVAEDDVVRLMNRISGCIGYAYDELDEVALTGALDDTNDEFRYPLMGTPPLTVHLARSPDGAAVTVRVEGPMKQILATRIAALLRPV